MSGFLVIDSVEFTDNEEQRITKVAVRKENVYKDWERLNGDVVVATHDNVKSRYIAKNTFEDITEQLNKE